MITIELARRRGQTRSWIDEHAATTLKRSTYYYYCRLLRHVYVVSMSTKFRFSDIGVVVDVLGKRVGLHSKYTGSECYTMYYQGGAMEKITPGRQIFQVDGTSPDLTTGTTLSGNAYKLMPFGAKKLNMAGVILVKTPLPRPPIGQLCIQII